MAKANVVVKIEGLEALRELVERLEKVTERVDGIAPSLVGNIQFHEPITEDVASAVRAAVQDSRGFFARGGYIR